MNFARIFLAVSLIVSATVAQSLAQQTKTVPAASPRSAPQNLCTVEGKSFPSYSTCVEHFAQIAEKNGTGRGHDHHDRDCRLAGCK